MTSVHPSPLVLAFSTNNTNSLFLLLVEKLFTLAGTLLRVRGASTLHALKVYYMSKPPRTEFFNPLHVYSCKYKIEYMYVALKLET